ncbi:Uncharacterised protein [Klebsiella pneumoniae]|uniref:DUF5983 family protein n=1 Tax=Klebsiella pneumoniae TaxID=573 RepID=UPI000E2AEC5C|nr:hypothetical protein [Klebsiella pneumoniae]SYU76648.1 Uncharacterised protein [Klebsiella pneumoniae]SYU91177.1 Uncharacterised protein [Klebsiella pneumoniae]
MAIVIKERYTTAVISTAHIAKDDSELLTDASYNPCSESGRNWIHANEYGYIIRITCENPGWKQLLRDDGISWPTIENIEKVIAAGFECVHFDRDADIVDELNTWEW